MNEDTLDIALGLHNANGYHIHALTAICSVMANTKHPVNVHLMHDDSLGGEEKAQFSALADRFSGAVVFHDMTGKVGVFPEIPALRNFSKGTFSRARSPGRRPSRRVCSTGATGRCSDSFWQGDQPCRRVHSWRSQGSQPYVRKGGRRPFLHPFRALANMQACGQKIAREPDE